MVRPASALALRTLRSATVCATVTAACWLGAVGAASAAGPDAGAIAGRVSDQTGAPLQGAAVSLTGQRHDSLVASETGEYRFDKLPAGRYALIFDFPGFARHELGDQEGRAVWPCPCA